MNSKDYYQMPFTKCRERCTLFRESSFRPYVTCGNFIDPKILLIKELPEKNTTICDYSKALSSTSDGQLRREFEKAGFDVDKDVAVTYLNLCNAYNDYGRIRKATSKEIGCCKCNLEATLNYFKDKVKYIVPLGGVVSTKIIGKKGIIDYHGKEFNTEWGTVIPIFNTKYILFKPHDKKIWQFDIKNLYNKAYDTYNQLEDNSKYTIIGYDKNFDNIGALAGVLESVRKHEKVSIDIETTGLHRPDHRIIGIGFSCKNKEAFYVPLATIFPEDSPFLRTLDNIDEFSFNAKTDAKVEKDKKRIKRFKYTRAYHYWGKYHKSVINLLSEFVPCGDFEAIGANYKFDMNFLESEWDIKINNLVWDVGHMSFLINENRPTSIKSLAEYYYPEKAGYQHDIYEHLSQTEIDEKCYIKLPIDVIGKYCCTDADVTFRLQKDLNIKLKTLPKCEKIYHTIYKPSTKIYLDKDKKGCFVDLDYVNASAEDYEKKLAEEEKVIWDLSNTEFNIGSGKQLGKVLFEKMNIPHLGYTNPDKDQYTTDEKTMTILSRDYPLARNILKYKEYAKNLGTFIYPIIRDHVDSRLVFASNLTGAITGRYSFKRYPIQTVPREKLIRNIFNVPDDSWFVEFDYSQIELRLFAWFSQDPVLCQLYKDKADVHTRMASEIFRIAVEKITANQRDKGKTTNFGVGFGAFGQTVADIFNKKLAHDADRVDAAFGDLCIEAFYRLYARIQPWKEDIYTFCRKHRYIENPFGRRRRLVNINSEDDNLRFEDEKMAVNSMIQGTADDIRKLADIKIERFREKNNIKSYVMWTMHDGMLSRIYKDEAFVIPYFKQIMENNPLPDFESPVDYDVSDRWKGKKIELNLAA